MDTFTFVLFTAITIPTIGFGLLSIIRGEKKQDKLFILWGLIGLALQPLVFTVAGLTSPPADFGGSFPLGGGGKPWADDQLDDHYLLFVAIAWALGIFWLLVLWFIRASTHRK
jgi:tellurite resistance protein TehA-like permease